MQSKIPLEWVHNLSNSEKEEFEKRLRASKTFTDKLVEILDKRILSEQRQEIQEGVYENPSWAFKQAHTNGKLEALYSIRKLFEFLDQRKD